MVYKGCEKLLAFVLNVFATTVVSMTALAKMAALLYHLYILQLKDIHMHKPSIGVAPEGLPFIWLLGLTTLTFAALQCWPMALLFLGLTFFSGHFFRDPERLCPDEAQVAVSPADGKIIAIESRPDPLSGEMKMCVSIFMNVFNVHVNRAPVAGTIDAIVYHEGAFFNAALDKASTQNERCTYRMLDADGREFVFVQIAGLIARRIVCRAERGDALKLGERFGLIRFGSRVDLFLPADYTICRTLGEKVTAGETVLAKRTLMA